MSYVITGGEGFLGWHVRVLMRALGWPAPVLLGRQALTDPKTVSEAMAGADVVLHLAGANRGTAADVVAGNVNPAAHLAAGLRRCGTPPKRIVFANSVQSGNGTPYGDAKATAADTLAAAADVGYVLDDVRLPNLYGEHGRPFYNSVVATFCRVLANGDSPEVHEDRALELVHVGDAAARLIEAPMTGSWDSTMPVLRVGVRALADRLDEYAADYRSGTIPPLTSRHSVRLFNTYRSHCFPDHYPMPLTPHSDARGELVELVRTRAGSGQTYCSTTRAGATRGEHFHLAKVERFCVLRGEGRISLRRVEDDQVLRFPVSGDRPVVVDMPTGWVHHITNTGTADLVTLFWANELYDPSRPDTYPEPVDQRVVESVHPAP
ncbi:NAD-dependent epimerase/dehydratase family protein [Plantactinospora sp. GCM10030261]|uniref:polysaccharide biosynthesis C-terminal domain-containing protein n=1 Tax=Plantactinospora sp. GCM10030261 TaxID=3273420 RepID=UPI00361F0B67